MNILFDQGTPVPLRKRLLGHQVDTVFERGWSTFANGELLALAEQNQYDVFITTDQNLRYQQNLSGRRISIIVLRTTSWPRIQQHLDSIQATIDACSPGDYHELLFS